MAVFGYDGYKYEIEKSKIQVGDGYAPPTFESFEDFASTSPFTLKVDKNTSPIVHFLISVATLESAGAEILDEDDVEKYNISAVGLSYYDPQYRRRRLFKVGDLVGYVYFAFEFGSDDIRYGTRRFMVRLEDSKGKEYQRLVTYESSISSSPTSIQTYRNSQYNTFRFDCGMVFAECSYERTYEVIKQGVPIREDTYKFGYYKVVMLSFNGIQNMANLILPDLRTGTFRYNDLDARALSTYQVERVLRGTNPIYGDSSSTSTEVETYDPTVPDRVEGGYDPITGGGGKGESVQNHGGGAGGGKGGGKNLISSDAMTPIPINQLPQHGIDTHFYTLYTPTKQQLQHISSVIWSQSFLDIIYNKFANLLDLVISLHTIPRPITSTGTNRLKIGFFTSEYDVNVCDYEYIRGSCGKITNLQRNFSNTFLDFEPYTKFKLFLPYVGIVDIRTDYAMANELEVVYTIDLYSGIIVYEILYGGCVYHKFTGKCSREISITSPNYGDQIADMTRLAVTAPNIIFSSPSVNAAASTVADAFGGGHSSGAMLTEGIGGDMTAGDGYVYLLRERPSISVPTDAKNFLGFGSYTTTTLGECTGFTKVQDIHLDDFGITEQEAAELTEILRNGVRLEWK